MGGGTLQLVITGGADIHIIGNPETSFFKSVYRRHTNFSIECIEQIRMGTITNRDFKLTYNIVHSGDLLNKMHFEIDLPKHDINNKIGHCGTLDPFAEGVLIVCIGDDIEKFQKINYIYN